MKLLLAVLCFILLVVNCASASAGILLNVDGKVYHADTEENITVQEILERLPLKLDMTRYAGHEYFAELQFRPKSSSEMRTSQLKAGGIYYWNGGNSFVINFKDYNIAPYNSVYLGIVKEVESLCAYLREAGENVSVSVLTE